MAKRKAVINESKCDGSPMCAARRMCPQKAITQKPDGGFIAKLLGGGTASVNVLSCTGCGICMQYCPHNAITMVKRH